MKLSDGGPCVLVVSGLYPTDENPADGIFVHEQVQALRRLGVDARVVTLKPFWMSARRLPQSLRRFAATFAGKSAARAWSVRDGVPVIYLHHLASVLVPPPLYPLQRARVLARALPAIRASFDYQLVHGHTAYWDGPAARAAARKADVPLVLTEHTGPLASVLDRGVKRAQVRLALGAASHVIAVSRALRDEMVARGLVGSAPISVVPNGVDTAFFAPPPSSRADQPRRLHAVWIGMHVAVKRVDRLLRAMALAGEQAPDLALTLVGDGPLRADNERLAAELGLAGRISFRPAVDRTGVRDALAAADFLVISSDVETFGVVGIEALSMGRPVLATRCGGPQDYIRGPLQGMLVPSGAEALADGLVEMARTHGERDSAAIRAFAIEHYDYGVVAHSLSGLYGAVLGGAAPEGAISGGAGARRPPARSSRP